MRYQNKTLKSNTQGFTLIELLVVIAIIALLSSIALIAFMTARQKGRDAKRISDMVQMNTAMALYFSTYKGYPTSTSGLPTHLVVAGIANSLPSAPLPADGGCEQNNYSAPATGNGSQYFYYASGTQYVGANNITVAPDYAYYFCLGNITGNFGPGVHIATPSGLR